MPTHEHERRLRAILTDRRYLSVEDGDAIRWALDELAACRRNVDEALASVRVARADVARCGTLLDENERLRTELNAARLRAECEGRRS